MSELIILTCKTCGCNNPGTSKKCNICGQTNLDYNSNSHKRWRCPLCKTINMIENKTCGGCFNYTRKDNCFITTATISSLNKEDDCYELKTFRHFRDTYLKANNPDIIDEYYNIAPQIVEKINQLDSKETVYLQIWEKHLKECLVLIEQKHDEEAFSKYKLMVEELKGKYLN